MYKDLFLAEGEKKLIKKKKKANVSYLLNVGCLDRASKTYLKIH